MTAAPSQSASLWQAFKEMLISALRVFALLWAWGFKIVGSLLLYVSSVLFKMFKK